MKKFFVLLLMLLPMGAFSQEVKLAFVDFYEVFDLMPEREEAENKYIAIRSQYEESLQTLNTELTAKFEEYQRIQETLTENLRLRKQQEITELQTRIENFIPQAQQDIEQEQAKLLAPIQEKVVNAIKAVGEEQGYAIMNAQVFFHTGSLIDATPLVKAKLGIR